jgi:hypothetical protein
VTGQIVSVVWHYCQPFSLRRWGKVFQWLPKDWHKKVSDFCKMKFTENDRTVCYFNKVRYLFGMNNQLTLPRTEKLFYFKITFIDLLVLTFLTTLTPLAKVVFRNEASPSVGDNKRLVCVRGDQCQNRYQKFCLQIKK